MEVIILAGGLGTRLQSLVNDIPKCMASVNGKPFLHYIFQYLIPFHPSRVILSLGYKHGIVEEWLQEAVLSFEVVTKVEIHPLGTGGAVKFAMSEVKEDAAVIINGDTFYDVDLSAMMTFYHSENREALLALKPMRQFDRYGSVRLEGNKLTGFEEKKYCEEGMINGGIYVLSKTALDCFPEKFSLEKDYFEKKASEGKLAGFISEGFFIDIGIPEDYQKAQTIFT